MSHPLIVDHIQVPPQALFAKDHIVGLCKPHSDEVEEEVNWRVVHRTVKYAGGKGGVPADRIVVIDYQDLADDSTHVREFEDMDAWLWVELPRAEAEPPVHASAEAA